MKISLALLALLLFAVTASADTVLTYTGNASSDPIIQSWGPAFQNPCGCALDGTVTLAAIIPSMNGADAHDVTPLSYSFSVNGLTFTQNNSTASFLFTIINGQVDFWHIQGSTPGGQYFLSYSYDLFEATDSAPGMYEQGNRGIWTAVTTPEPGTLELLGAGLLAVLARRRWQLRHRQVPKATWEPLA